MVSLTGNWTGEITGTNKGHVAVEMVEADQRLSGEIRINDLHHGVAIYDYEGHRRDSALQLKGLHRPDYQPSSSVSVHGRPVVIQQSVRHGEIIVEGCLVALYTTKLYGAEQTEGFGRGEHLLKQAQDVFKRLPVVCRNEDGLANAVEAIAKQALGGPLMRFERNRFDLVPPSPHVPGPAKRDRQHTP